MTDLDSIMKFTKKVKTPIIDVNSASSLIVKPTKLSSIFNNIPISTLWFSVFLLVIGIIIWIISSYIAPKKNDK